MTEHTQHQMHADHQHGEGCGHEAVQHEGHTDYIHDGHAHAAHEGHWDEHAMRMQAPDASRQSGGGTPMSGGEGLEGGARGGRTMDTVPEID